MHHNEAPWFFMRRESIDDHKSAGQTCPHDAGVGTSVSAQFDGDLTDSEFDPNLGVAVAFCPRDLAREEAGAAVAPSVRRKRALADSGIKPDAADHLLGTFERDFTNAHVDSDRAQELLELQLTDAHVDTDVERFGNKDLHLDGHAPATPLAEPLDRQVESIAALARLQLDAFGAIDAGIQRSAAGVLQDDLDHHALARGPFDGQFPDWEIDVDSLAATGAEILGDGADAAVAGAAIPRTMAVRATADVTRRMRSPGTRGYLM